MKKLSFKRSLTQDTSAYLFILPSVLMFLLFVLYPLILSVVISFQERGLVHAKWIGLANFKNIFSDAYFFVALKNTFLFVLFLVPALTIVGFLAAVQINKLSHGLRSFFRAAFYLPVVLSGVVISLIWLLIFNPSYGLLNYLVSLFGGGPIIWMASPGTLYYLMFVVFTFNFGTVLIIYLAALGNIPEDMYEAARIDGAKTRTITWKITFPLLKPTTF